VRRVIQKVIMFRREIDLFFQYDDFRCACSCSVDFTDPQNSGVAQSGGINFITSRESSDVLGFLSR